MAKIRVKRAATFSNPTLQSGELGLIGDNLYFGKYSNPEVGGSPTRLANQNAGNDFTGVNNFSPASTTQRNVQFFNYLESPQLPTVVTYVENGRLYTVDPTESQQVATKSYVDGLVQGLAIKDSVRVATNGPIALSGYQEINDVNLNEVGIRVLVKDQVDKKQNGIYLVSSGNWTRALDADTWDKLISAFVFVEEGYYADTGWVCKADLGSEIGTGDIEWTQFSGAGSFTPGNGLITDSSGTMVEIDTSVTMDLTTDQVISGDKTFVSSTLKIKGSSAGVTTITNTSTGSHTLTLPNTSGTIAITDQLHNQSHAMTSTSDHTAGNWQMFYSNGTGKVVELPLSATSGHVLKSNGGTAAPSWGPLDLDLGNNILEGDFNTYKPYATRTEGTFYVNDTLLSPMGSLAPISDDWHLGFDGIFYATKFEGIIDGGDW